LHLYPASTQYQHGTDRQTQERTDLLMLLLPSYSTAKTMLTSSENCVVHVYCTVYLRINCHYRLPDSRFIWRNKRRYNVHWADNKITIPCMRLVLVTMQIGLGNWYMNIHGFPKNVTTLFFLYWFYDKFGNCGSIQIMFPLLQPENLRAPI